MCFRLKLLPTALTLSPEHNAIFVYGRNYDLRKFSSWEQNSRSEIQVSRNKKSSQTNAYSHYPVLIILIVANDCTLNFIYFLVTWFSCEFTRVLPYCLMPWLVPETINMNKGIPLQDWREIWNANIFKINYSCSLPAPRLEQWNKISSKKHLLWTLFSPVLISKSFSFHLKYDMWYTVSNCPSLKDEIFKCNWTSKLQHIRSKKAHGRSCLPLCQKVRISDIVRNFTLLVSTYFFRFKNSALDRLIFF